MLSDAELRGALAAAMRGFAAAAGEIGDDDWSRPSVCDGWSIFDLVEHIVAGDRFAALVLAGATLDDAVAEVVGVDHLGEDPIGNLATAAGGARKGFDGPLDRTVAHPIGPIAARRFIGFRVLDQLGHTWDVAASLGRTIFLDPGAIHVALAVCEIERDMLDASEHFAMSSRASAESDPQTRFLHAVGRG